MSAHSVLFINRVYPPLEGATGHLLAELASALAAAGWRVTVLTSGARRGSEPIARQEDADGVRVERVSALGWARSSFWCRALSYLFLYPAFLRRVLSLPRPAVIVLMTDPPLLVLLGPILRRLTGARLVHWAQDIYPEVAEEMGVLRKDGWLANALRHFSQASLRRCDAIVAVGECMRQRLQQRGLDPQKLVVIPNWAVGLRCRARVVKHDQKAALEFRKAQGWEGQFIVMYSGNFGRAHQFEPILAAAEILEARQCPVRFVLAGHGPLRGWLKKEVQRRQLQRLTWLPWQPADRVAASLGAADVHLATMREELCGLVVPSKVYGILGAGRPCLFLGPPECEVAQLIEREGCGEVLTTATGEQLAQRLALWAADPDRVEAAARQSQALRIGLSCESALQPFDDLLERVGAGAQPETWSARPAGPGTARGTDPLRRYPRAAGGEREAA